MKLLHIEFSRVDWYYCGEFQTLIECAVAVAAGESVSGGHCVSSDVMDEFQRNWCEQVYTLWTATGSGGAIELVQIYQQSIGIGAIYAGHDEEMARLCDDALDAAIEQTLEFAIKVVKQLTATATNPKTPAKKKRTTRMTNQHPPTAAQMTNQHPPTEVQCNDI